MTSSRVTAIRKRIARFGLKCHCPICGDERRHFPRDGRLRFQRCALDGGRLRAGWPSDGPKRTLQADRL